MRKIFASIKNFFIKVKAVFLRLCKRLGPKIKIGLLSIWKYINKGAGFIYIISRWIIKKISLFLKLIFKRKKNFIQETDENIDA